MYDALARKELAELGPQQPSYPPPPPPCPPAVHEDPILNIVVRILGWQNCANAQPPQISMGTLVARGRTFEVRLSGFAEFVNVVAPPNIVPIRCGSGSWSANLPFNVHPKDIFDLTDINNIAFHQQHDCNLWKVAKEHFEMVLIRLEKLWERVDEGTVLWFYCKGGHHRSYAGCIMFLMWVTHVHDPAVFVFLISAQRANVELFTYWEMWRRRRGDRQVPFADVVHQWGTFLNTTFPKHAWHFS